MRKQNEEIELPFPDVEFADKWGEWLLYRKQLRLKNYVPVGLKRTFSQLIKDSGNNAQVAIQMIDQSMAYNWRGIFPLKNNANGQGNINNGRQQGFSDDKLKAALLRNIANQ